MSVTTSEGPAGMQVHVRGQLDSAEVRAIETLLAGAHPGAVFVLDFRDTRSFRPAALTRLARGLSASGRHVSLRGLSEYHYRLLRYVGLSSAAVGTGEVPAD
jgi:hypothetical protein